MRVEGISNFGINDDCSVVHHTAFIACSRSEQLLRGALQPLQGKLRLIVSKEISHGGSSPKGSE